MEESATPTKYILPHRRTKMTGFTSHAKQRQQQRNISSTLISQALSAK